MKKLYAILMMAVFILSLVPAVFADNETNETVTEDESTEEIIVEEVDESEDEVDDETEEEIEAMDTLPGAQVRLLQLERSITKGLISGSEVVAFITENDSEADVSALEEILDEMEALLVILEDVDLEKDADELAQEFVDVKKQARDLSKDFRERSRELLGPEGREALNIRIDESLDGALDEYDEEIGQLKNEHNAQKIEKFFAKIGVDASDLAERLRNGEATYAEIRQEVRNEFGKLNSEQKRDAAKKVKEEKIKKNVARKEQKNKLEEGMDERLRGKSAERKEEAFRIKEERKEKGQKALDRAKEIRENAKARVENVKERNADLRERNQELRERNADVREKAGELKGKLQDRRDGRRSSMPQQGEESVEGDE